MSCRVDGCDREIKTKKSGLCGMHYERMKRDGDPGEASPRKEPNGTYSHYFNGEQYWHSRELRSEYQKRYVKEKRKKDPDFHKSIKAMHKKRFGGLRERVLKRDNYTCQICGMNRKEHKDEWGMDITIDHKDRKGRYSERMNNEEDNLWVLCLRCHGRIDYYRWAYEQGKTVPEDILMYIEGE
jgi:5-methylcytosine-specific restriction endonuclease McrA